MKVKYHMWNSNNGKGNTQAENMDECDLISIKIDDITKQKFEMVKNQLEFRGEISLSSKGKSYICYREPLPVLTNEAYIEIEGDDKIPF